MRTRHCLSLLTITSMCFAPLGAAFAQTPSAPRFEVGGQLSALRLSDFDATNAGLGGRLSVDVFRWMTVEAEANFFPHDDVIVMGSPELGTTYHRRRAEAFFGPKAGIRGHRIGIFAKARPGFARLTDKGSECLGDVCALALLARATYRTEFALDVGGVLEYYPSARTVLRVDLGDTMVQHRSSAPPCWGGECTSHNFSSRFGVGVRF